MLVKSNYNIVKVKIKKIILSNSDFLIDLKRKCIIFIFYLFHTSIIIDGL